MTVMPSVLKWQVANLGHNSCILHVHQIKTGMKYERPIMELIHNIIYLIGFVSHFSKPNIYEENKIIKV